MADLDPSVVDALNRAFAESQQTLTGFNSGLARSNKSFDKTIDSITGVADSGTQAKQSLIQMSGAAVKLTSQIYRGEQGLKKYADAVDSAAEAIGAMTFMLGGPLIKALTVLTLGLFKLGKAATEQADALFKSYQAISRSGAAAADGLQGVFNMMQDFSLGVDNIDQMNSLIASNAQSLALFQGTVYDGARAMGSIAKEVKESGLRREFQGLGMTVQEQNETLAGFIALQSRLGIQEVKNNKDITASLNRYVAETDAITKLTGANRQKQEELQQAALQTEMFRAKIDRMRAAGDTEGANMLMMRYKALGSVSEDLAQGFAESVNGVLITEKAIGAFQLTNGKIQQYAMDRNMKLGVFLEKTGDAVRDGLGGALGTAAAELGMFRDITGLAYNGISDFAEITKGAAGKLDDIAAVQARQRELSEKGLKNQVNASEADLNSMQSMQRFVNIGVNPATSALATLAGVVESLTSMLPGKRTTATAAGATAGAATGAAIGSVIPGIGTAIGAGVGAVVGGVGGFMAGGGGEKVATTQGMIDPDKVIKFTSGTGSRDHFDKLQPAVKQAFLGMARDYNNLTGEKLQVNSAFRSLGEQAAVNPGANPKAAPGMSRHNEGRALDIQSSQADFLISQGLLGKYGFRSGREFNDPPHIFMRDGGIATGPKSGYAATLHGTEAVIPLPDGKTVPVVMPELVSGLRDQMSMMGAQLMALQDMVSLMRDQTTISTKILQAANN